MPKQASLRSGSAAVAKHGQFNTYYLYNAQCVFHLTNDEKIGMIGFRFEGTVLTDSDDLKTLASDFDVEASMARSANG